MEKTQGNIGFRSCKKLVIIKIKLCYMSSFIVLSVQRCADHKPGLVNASVISRDRRVFCVCRFWKVPPACINGEYFRQDGQDGQDMLRVVFNQLSEKRGGLPLVSQLCALSVLCG